MSEKEIQAALVEIDFSVAQKFVAELVEELGPRLTPSLARALGEILWSWKNRVGGGFSDSIRPQGRNPKGIRHGHTATVDRG
jgi:hypothetical protein